MSNFPIIDLVAGLIFIYFLLSIVVNVVIEIVLTASRARSKVLGEWLLTTFSKQVVSFDSNGNTVKVPLGEALMDHFAINGLTKSKQSPSYIEASNFVAAFLDKIAYDPQNTIAYAKDLKDIIYFLSKTQSLHPDLQRTFLGFAFDAQTTYAQLGEKTQSEIQLFQAKLENWFNTSTVRLSGDLKRKYTAWLTPLVAVIMVVGFNIDSIRLAQFLYSNPEVAAGLAAKAYQAPADSNYISIVSHIKASPGDTLQVDSSKLNSIVTADIQRISSAKSALQSTALPMGDLSANYTQLTSATGKDQKPGNFWSFLGARIPGWLLTIFAVCMGAPFWFDLLSQLANLRGTGSKPVPAATTSSTGASN